MVEGASYLRTSLSTTTVESDRSTLRFLTCTWSLVLTLVIVKKKHWLVCYLIVDFAYRKIMPQ